MRKIFAGERESAALEDCYGFWMVKNMEISQREPVKKILDQIIDYIIKNELTPGDRLPTEKELTSILCTSRSVLREVLSILAAMHIIRIVQGSGIYVESPKNAVMQDFYQTYMKLGYASIDEMFEFWIRLEADCAAYAARHIPQQGIYELEMCIEESKSAIFSQKKFFESDIAFHNILASYCQNRLFTMNLHSISKIITQYRAVTTYYLDIRKTAYEYHTRIYDALRTHDSVLAGMYMEEHLTEVKRAADFYELFQK